jgi:hypothetical protein
MASLVQYIEDCFCFWKGLVPQGRKRANTGCTQTTAVVPAEPEFLWKASHPCTIQGQCYLASLFEWELVHPTWQLCLQKLDLFLVLQRTLRSIDIHRDSQTYYVID